VKLPFRWTVTWTNGQSTYEIRDIQPDTAIDSSKFAKPAPARVTPKAAAR
jgi:outer membrane lipoprotein-sorting protein